MTTVLEFSRNLHNLPLEIRGYLNLVEHMYSQYHGRQLRDSGEPYIEHICDVMRQMIEMEAPWEVVVAAGLHDIIEDTAEMPNPVTKEMIELAFSIKNPEFGRRVAFITDANSKKPKSMFQIKEERLGEYRCRLIECAKIDYWVLPPKLADRRHNLFTLHGLSFDPNKQIRIAQETLDFYVPLALGKAKELIPVGFHYWLDECAHQMKCVALAFLNGVYEVNYTLRS